MGAASDRRTVLLGILLGIASIVSTSFVRSPYRILYNPSESAPRGWYLLKPALAIETGGFVVAHLPAEPARLADERGYLPIRVPVLKRVAATSGHRVCEQGGRVAIDGTVVAFARARDGSGRRLAPWQGCQVLSVDHLFLLSRDSQASFDSRYFGPIERSDVIGRAVSLWTW